MSRLSIETPGRCPKCLRWSASGYGAPHWCQCLRTVSGGYVFELPAAVPCADLWEMCALPHWSGTVGGADRAGA